MLQVRRPVHENNRGRQRVTTGTSINHSRPAPMTSSCRPVWPTAGVSRQPVLDDVRVRPGVLSQLPVIAESMTSRTLWNKPRCSVAVPRRLSTQSKIVTTDYGWIDSGEVDRADESDKENCYEETGQLEDGNRRLQRGAETSEVDVGSTWKSLDSFEDGTRNHRRLQKGGGTFEVDVGSPWKSLDSFSSMDVDDDGSYVDMRPYNSSDG